MSTSSGSLRTVDMSFLSNATNYVDNNGVGHVKVNNSKDWSEILPNNTTARIVYEGSGSTEEVVIIPSDGTASRTAKSFSGSLAESSPGDYIDNPSTDSGNSTKEIDKGSTPTTLLIVGIVLGAIAIATIFAVVRYNRRNRRREEFDDPDVPFIVGSLPRQNTPQLGALDTDIKPDLWVEGQYQYSPAMSGLENSLSGTAILSDNNTIASRNRLTVDAYTYGSNTRRGPRHTARLSNNQRVCCDDASSYNVSERGRNRRGTSPIVLYEQDSYEECKSSPGRKIHQNRRSSLRQRQHSPRMRHHRRQESQHQRRRDMHATRRDL